MIKTLKNLLKQDKERYTVPRKVQDVIPVRRIWKDGIFQVGGRFSKTYQFTDINYLVASREDKEQMFLAYSELLNSLDSGATTKITINNRRLNRANFEQSILMPIRDVPQGDFVGYDRAYQTERDSKIAILPIGYGDGFPRNLSCGKASVKIGTYIVPIIGRICMDQLAIDITDTEGVAVGDTATLIDNQENSLLSTPCVAERSDSISNEILSRMGARLPIVIKE